MSKNSLSILAVIVSMLALLTSVRSCVIADKTHQLNVQQYNDTFRTLWKGVYDKEREVFSITPTNDNVMIQRARVYYPDEISNTDWPIDPPDYLLHFTSPKFSIETVVENNIKAKKGFTKILDDSRIPVVIESHYTINGVGFYEKSLYLIEYMAIIFDDELKRPSVDIKGLVFGQRLDPEIAPRSYLNEMWGKGGT